MIRLRHSPRAPGSLPVMSCSAARSLALLAVSSTLLSAAPEISLDMLIARWRSCARRAGPITGSKKNIRAVPTASPSAIAILVGAGQVALHLGHDVLHRYPPHQC